MDNSCVCVQQIVLLIVAITKSSCIFVELIIFKKFASDTYCIDTHLSHIDISNIMIYVSTSKLYTYTYSIL